MKRKTAQDFLPKEVAEKYEVVEWVGGHRQRFGHYGVIDLTKLNLAKAKALVNTGFSKLLEKQIVIEVEESEEEIG